MNWSKEDLDKKLKENPHLKVADPLLDAPGRKNKGFQGSDHTGHHKYRAKPQFFNGFRYPSKKQAEKAQELDLLKRAGKIKGFIEEVPFRLPGHSVHRVDFGIINLDNTITWLEIKGRDLAMGKLKRRQVEELYKIKIIIE